MDDTLHRIYIVYEERACKRKGFIGWVSLPLSIFHPSSQTPAVQTAEAAVQHELEASLTQCSQSFCKLEEEREEGMVRT